MNRLPRIFCGLAVLLATALHAAPARPNIVLILADDLGYSDLGCYGGEIQTPNLDALAAGGLRFSHFYNGGRCCPTRAALITGLYPHQAGIGRMTMDAKLPGYRGRLLENTVTLAEVLRSAGYRTAMVGKWHVSITEEKPDHLRYLSNQAIYDTFSDPKSYPVARGFEEHYGFIWGVVNYFDPFSLVHNYEPVREVPKDYYVTDALNDWAVRFIEKYGGGAEPFFLYLAHAAPHWPLHALPEDIARYEGVYKAGWQAIREARYRRMIENGLLPPDQQCLSPRHNSEAQWEDNPTRDWDAAAMATHAAMIDRMDQGIGRVIAKLRQMNQLDNTLILFLADNGASPEAYPSPGFDRPAQLRDGRPITYPPAKPKLPGPADTFFGFGPDWANVANTPLRFWKAEMYEGGICTPLIASWPKGLKTKAGSITHQPGHVIDMMATCVELAGATYPTRFENRPITPLQGRSLVPLFNAGIRDGHPFLAWEHFGARAIRKDNWKMVARPGQPWQLYNLAADRSELNDVAAQYPQQVREMDGLWSQWAKETNVLPRPGKPGKKRG